MSDETVLEAAETMVRMVFTDAPGVDALTLASNVVRALGLRYDKPLEELWDDVSMAERMREAGQW